MAGVVAVNGPGESEKIRDLTCLFYDHDGIFENDAEGEDKDEYGEFFQQKSARMYPRKGGMTDYDNRKNS